MFDVIEYGVKSKRILRSVIGLNIICLLVLVFYVFHVISFELLLYSQGDIGNIAYPWWTLPWIIAFVLVITLIAVQLTLDVEMMLFKDELDEIKIKDRVETWIKVTSLFLVISTLGFSLSLFTPGRENPWLILIVGFGGLILRFIQLSLAYRYLASLRASVVLHSCNV